MLLGQDFTLLSGATVTFQGCLTPPTTFICPPHTFWSDLNGDGLTSADECIPDINS